jgi:hypothetical protein
LKKHLKVIASIRKDGENPCPFGLPIPFGCSCAGKHIENMAPLDVMEKATNEEKEMISKANTKLLAWNLLRTSEKPNQCLYVGHLLEDKDVVECNYDDTAPGEGAGKMMTAAPFYSKQFSGIVNGLYTYPIGYYSDYNISRNLYYGAYSLQGSSDRENLIKFAIEEVIKDMK